MEELPDKEELERRIKNLVGLEKRYYETIPDPCWMSEKNQVNLLNIGSYTKIGRTKLRKVKNKLIKERLLLSNTTPMGKRKNLKHELRKTYPIILEREASPPLSELYNTYTPEDEEYALVAEINWSLLKQYTAHDINKMDRMTKVKLYMDCGFIVLPAHYPIFTENSIACSCKDGVNCSNIGKHPIHKYKYIDQLNYERMKDIYLQEFGENTNLNVGFKVMGYSVLDVDNRHGGDESLAKLVHESDIEMSNVISVKCSNGQHIYATNLNLKNTAGSIGNGGLDIRSEGGFIIAPGSIHKSGLTYEWNEIGEVATLPEEWFYTESEKNEASNRTNPIVALKQRKDIELPRTLTADYRISEGERELTLFKWGCRERGMGKNVEQIYDILITIRDNYCEEGKEPVTDVEVKGIANCAAKYPPNAQKNNTSDIGNVSSGGIYINK